MPKYFAGNSKEKYRIVKTMTISIRKLIIPTMLKIGISVTGEYILWFVSNIEKIGSAIKPNGINRIKNSAPH